MVSTQKSSIPRDESPSTPKPGVGGNAVGIIGTVGRPLSPRVSFDLEISVPARFDSLQGFRAAYFSRTDNRHRDLIVSGLFHLHVRQAGAIRPELVGGISYVHEDTLQRTAYQIGPTFGVYGPYGPESRVIGATFGLTGGADLGVHVTARVSLVPQVRFHWILREDVGPRLNLSPYVIRAALGLRAAI